MTNIFLEVVVIVALQFFWQRLSGPKVAAQTEVERIADLQQAAMARRAEYAAEREQAVPGTERTALPGLPPPSRKRVEEAERAYTVALQAWENGQSRLNSH
jgi:hypothetical protein